MTTTKEPPEQVDTAALPEAEAAPVVKAKTGVMLATPVRYWKGLEQFHPDFQATLTRLAELSNDPLCPYEFQWASCTGGICVARNRMVSNFKKERKSNPNLKWLVWWDDDVCASAEDIIRLISHKEGICGALYTTREDKPHWVANFMYDAEVQTQGVKDGLLQVVECGTGLKAYFWEVFKVLEEVYPMVKYFDRNTGEEHWGWFQQVVMNEDFPTEDYYLDWLVRQAAGRVKGLGIFVDTKLKLRHRFPDGTTCPKDDAWPPIPGIE